MFILILQVSLFYFSIDGRGVTAGLNWNSVWCAGAAMWAYAVKLLVSFLVVTGAPSGFWNAEFSVCCIQLGDFFVETVR